VHGFLCVSSHWQWLESSTKVSLVEVVRVPPRSVFPKSPTDRQVVHCCQLLQIAVSKPVNDRATYAFQVQNCGSGTGIRTLNLAVNSSLRPVQK
jgi:hypothetical protein